MAWLASSLKLLILACRAYDIASSTDVTCNANQCPVDRTVASLLQSKYSHSRQDAGLSLDGDVLSAAPNEVLVEKQLERLLPSTHGNCSALPNDFEKPKPSSHPPK